MKILVIDDEKNILHSVVMYLEGYGYEVFSSDNGIKGIESAEIHRPDLILLDLVLPDVDGYTVCKTLKKHSEMNKIPIIIMSAKNQKEDLSKAFENGADDYIIKPFQPNQLIEIIKKVLKGGIK